jgi:hypothetical protein
MNQVSTSKTASNFCGKQDHSKYITYPGKTNDFANEIHEAEYRHSMDDKESFWKKQA